MRSHDTTRRAARPTAVHLFCALVLGLTGCAGGSPATNAAGQAIVGGVPGAPAILSRTASPFGDPAMSPSLDIDHPGIAGFERDEAPALEVAPDVVLTTRGDLGELGDISRLVAPSPATPPAAPPATPPASPPTDENPTTPPPERNHAEIVYMERYDALDTGEGRVELLRGEARCAAMVTEGACGLVVCDPSAMDRRVVAPMVAFGVGDEVFELEAEDVDQPLYMTSFGTDAAEPAALSAYVEGEEGGPVFMTDLAATNRQASLETLTVGTTGLQPGGSVTVRAPDDVNLGWASYADGGALRVILTAGNDRSSYVECTFDPSEGEGTVPASLLDQLGARDVDVEVASMDEKVNLVDADGAVWTVGSRNERGMMDEVSISRR